MAEETPPPTCHVVDDVGCAASDSSSSFPSISSQEVLADDDIPPPIPDRRYSMSDVGFDVMPPPLPERNYSWSELEDNDEDALQSEESAQEEDGEEGGEEEEEGEEGGEEEEGEGRGEANGKSKENLATVAVEQPDQSISTSSNERVKQKKKLSKEEKEIRNKEKLLRKLEKKAEKEKEIRKKKEKRREKVKRLMRSKKGFYSVTSLKNSTSSSVSIRQRYFERKLDEVSGESGIPTFVSKCIELIESQALDWEGIYRISGSKEDVLLLQERFDEDNNLDLKVLDSVVTELPYTVASALKNFFRLLPDALIADEIAEKLLEVKDTMMDRKEQLSKLQEVLLTLPSPNLKTLRCLASHLNLVQKNVEANKMSASNLAIVFWPTLMRPSVMDLMDQTKQLKWHYAMTCIIEHPECLQCNDSI